MNSGFGDGPFNEWGEIGDRDTLRVPVVQEREKKRRAELESKDDESDLQMRKSSEAVEQRPKDGAQLEAE